MKCAINAQICSNFVFSLKKKVFSLYIMNEKYSKRNKTSNGAVVE